MVSVQMLIPDPVVHDARAVLGFGALYEASGIFPLPPSDFRASLSMAFERKGPDCNPSKKTPLDHIPSATALSSCQQMWVTQFWLRAHELQGL